MPRLANNVLMTTTPVGSIIDRPRGLAAAVFTSRDHVTPFPDDYRQWTHVESKEFLAGFWIVDVNTPERAYAIAAEASAAPGSSRRATHH
jgi:hypothetical protein